MWHVYIHSETLTNGDKVNVRVRFREYSGSFEVDDITLIPKGKRKEVFIKSILTDEYSYRKLNQNDRHKAEMKRFVEVAGIEVINSALQAAWENTKPKIVTDEDYNIEY